MALLLRGILLGIIGYVFWRLLRPRCAIRIVVDQDGVKSHTGLPRSSHATILNWIARRVVTERRITICVTHGRDGRPKISFSGPIDQDTEQLVRNFLLSELT